MTRWSLVLLLSKAAMAATCDGDCMAQRNTEAPLTSNDGDLRLLLMQRRTARVHSIEQQEPVREEPPPLPSPQPESKDSASAESPPPLPKAEPGPESTAAAWVTSAWGSCTQKCGKAFKFREVECFTLDGAVAADTGACDAEFHPRAVKECSCGTEVCTSAPCNEDDELSQLENEAASNDEIPEGAWDCLGCYALDADDSAAPAGEATFRDPACIDWKKDTPCKSGLPFFRMHSDAMTPTLCFEFCIGQGLDLFGLVEGQECRCGASKLNTQVWHDAPPRPGLVLPVAPASVSSCDGGGVCPVRVYRFKGPYESKGVPSSLLDPNLGDQTYVDSIVKGKAEQVAEEEDDLPARQKEQEEEEARVGEELKKGATLLEANPSWLRSCRSGSCQPGRTWSVRSATPPAGVADEWEDYVIIPYTFDLYVDNARKEVFRAATDRWREGSCINYVERASAPTNEGYTLVGIYNSGSCWANLGAPEHPEWGWHSKVNLGWCNNLRETGSVAHELGHNLGMNHEQKRPDAGATYNGEGPHLKIYWWNIPSNWVSEFSTVAAGYMGSAENGVAKYDFESLMHYPRGSSAYSNAYDTIPIEYNNVAGQRSHIAPSDYAQINDVYNCRRKGSGGASGGGAPGGGTGGATATTVTSTTTKATVVPDACCAPKEQYLAMSNANEWSKYCADVARISGVAACDANAFCDMASMCAPAEACCIPQARYLAMSNAAEWSKYCSDIGRANGLPGCGTNTACEVATDCGSSSSTTVKASTTPNALTTTPTPTISEVTTTRMSGVTADCCVPKQSYLSRSNGDLWANYCFAEIGLTGGCASNMACEVRRNCAASCGDNCAFCKTDGACVICQDGYMRIGGKCTQRPGTAAEVWVKLHNIFRCVHGVPPVTWSAAAAANAQNYVNTLSSLVHADSYNIPPPAGPAGENLAMNHLDPATTSQAWYDEVNCCSTLPGCQYGSCATGHFTAMVWKGVTEIGCATNARNKIDICRYRSGDTVSGNSANMGGFFTEMVPRQVKDFQTCINEVSGVSPAATTTRAPTTQAPTTRAPTTRAPTTQAPQTQAPTTQAPTTQAPTTRAPTTQAPTTQAPTTRAPTTRAPTTQAPTDACCIPQAYYLSLSNAGAWSHYCSEIGRINGLPGCRSNTACEVAAKCGSPTTTAVATTTRATTTTPIPTTTSSKVTVTNDACCVAQPYYLSLSNAGAWSHYCSEIGRINGLPGCGSNTACEVATNCGSPTTTAVATAIKKCVAKAYYLALSNADQWSHYCSEIGRINGLTGCAANTVCEVATN